MQNYYGNVQPKGSRKGWGVGSPMLRLANFGLVAIHKNVREFRGGLGDLKEA